MIETLGGLGFFLLGMLLMTDGLHGLAGHSMRRALMRFTHSPTSGAITGASCTALLQSSSATTIAAIGFVGAGLLSFPQALGIIFGANIGTTMTGWLVTLIGFKLQLGNVALILVLTGALLRLFARSTLRHGGTALAGFGLIFVGISYMQSGMYGLRELFDFSSFGTDGWYSRLQLVAIGIAITLITQSSSAGVAMTLTALYTDTIAFEQAAALVVGMDIGTTGTAAIATVGGSVSARRTGFSHIIYNLMTGSAAFLLITPYIALWQWLAPGTLVQHAEIALVAFHSSFNALGVVLALPFTYRFARFIEHLFPGDDRYISALDRQLLAQPPLAISAVEVSLHRQLGALLEHLQCAMTTGSKHSPINLERLQSALDETQQYIDDIHLPVEAPTSDTPHDWQRLTRVVNIIDHLQRLHERCEEDADRAMVVQERDDLSAPRQQLLKSIKALSSANINQQWQLAITDSAQVATKIRTTHQQYRQQITQRMSDDSLDVDIGIHCLQAARWLERVSHHLARICKHLNESQQEISSSANTGQQ